MGTKTPFSCLSLDYQERGWRLLSLPELSAFAWLPLHPCSKALKPSLLPEACRLERGPQSLQDPEEGGI